MFKEEVAKLIASAVSKGEGEIEKVLEIPPDASMGDFAFPCFILSKDLKKPPHLIAKDLVSQIKRTDSIEKIEAKGPYVNFFVSKQILAKEILQKIHKEGLEYGKIKHGAETVVIEFPAPNTNKPLHLGHIRNLLLGESVSRILEFVGSKVVRVDLINDRGVHICKSMLAYKKWGESKDPNKKSDHFVGDFYVMYSKKAKDDEGLEKEVRQMLLQWESRDKVTIELWEKMNKWAIDGFNQTYARLGIKHEKVYFESQMFEHGKKIIQDGLKKGIFEKDEEGNVFVPLEEYGMPNRVLLRADGTSIYITQDIYLAMSRFKDFNFSKSLYVVGNEQNLHFRQLFKVLELLGFERYQDCYHLSYGMIFLPEGKMKSREGTIVDADNLIDEVKQEAANEIKKRHKLQDAELNTRAEMIGMGGLKFFVLKYDVAKDFVFNPKESISFEGETGPYIQYAYARICSILKKNGLPVTDKIDFSLLDQEKHIIQHLADFPQVIQDAAKHYKPSTVARFLLSLSQDFNEYYHKTPILKTDENTKLARLFLITCIKDVICSGLNLLGIDAPEQM